MTFDLARFVMSTEPNGFCLTETDAQELQRIDRLCLVLVRCGGCRFLCPVQDLPTMTGHIAAGGDYIRDVSFPCNLVDEAKAAAALDRRQANLARCYGDPSQ